MRRERVPFVLTHDFVYVISKGRNDRDSEEFLYFQNMCERVGKHNYAILTVIFYTYTYILNFVVFFIAGIFSAT